MQRKMREVEALPAEQAGALLRRCHATKRRGGVTAEEEE